MGRTAEQQTLDRDRRTAEQPVRQETERHRPERERLAGPALTARAALEGAPLLDLPPRRLEELAALVGNQEMAALLERQALPLEQAPFTLPPPADTAPFPVPEGEPALAGDLSGLTQHPWGGRAFDPADLAE